jgi:hypothetical protein
VQAASFGASAFILYPSLELQPLESIDWLPPINPSRLALPVCVISASQAQTPHLSKAPNTHTRRCGPPWLWPLLSALRLTCAASPRLRLRELRVRFTGVSAVSQGPLCRSHAIAHAARCTRQLRSAVQKGADLRTAPRGSATSVNFGPYHRCVRHIRRVTVRCTRFRPAPGALARRLDYSTATDTAHLAQPSARCPTAVQTHVCPCARARFGRSPADHAALNVMQA